jgi:hypothetical protein
VAFYYTENYENSKKDKSAKAGGSEWGIGKAKPNDQGMVDSSFVVDLGMTCRLHDLA